MINLLEYKKERQQQYEAEIAKVLEKFAGFFEGVDAELSSDELRTRHGLESMIDPIDMLADISDKGSWIREQIAEINQKYGVRGDKQVPDIFDPKYAIGSEENTEKVEGASGMQSAGGKFGSYPEYVTMEKSLSITEMERIHSEMLDSVGTDEDALELYEELVQQANRYVQFRSNWPLWSREEKTEKDPSRTSCHDSLIVKFSQLVKYLKMQDKDARWMFDLGYIEEDPFNRKRIGDFACYIVFVNSICAR